MFIKTYLDENISVLIGKIIRSHGFVVLTTQEAGNNGKSDIEQLEFAVANKHAILTHNQVDFEN
jgi:predicted nuclease of predicted toxin-antitoxin system